MATSPLSFDGPDEVADRDSQETAANAVRVNGKSFATGLFWQPLSRPRHYMAEARKYGKDHGWDIVAIRKGRRIQAGFVRKDAGAIKGMYSLAASLAGILGDTWLGAFEIGDGRYFVCAVKDGSIVPGFDLIAKTAEQALAKLAEGMGVVGGDDEHIFAPAHFQFAQKSHQLADLLQTKRLRKEYQLRQLRFGLTRKEWFLFGGIALLLVAAMFGMGQYQTYREHQRREEAIRREQARRAELDRLNSQAKTKQTVQALAHPWASMPSAADFAAACGRATATIPLSVGGWVFKVATCDSKGVSIAYRRAEGGPPVSQFVAGAAGKFSGEPAFSENGNLAIVGLPLAVAFAGDDALSEPSALLNDVVSYFQANDVKPTVSERPIAAPAATAAPAAAASQPSAQPTWRTYLLEYQASTNPSVHFSELAGRPGLRLSEIKLSLDADAASLTWDVKGEVYAIR